jgi:hypothetical protein
MPHFPLGTGTLSARFPSLVFLVFSINTRQYRALQRELIRHQYLKSIPADNNKTMKILPEFVRKSAIVIKT